MNRRNRAAIRALGPLVLMGLIFFFSSQQADEGFAWWEIVARKVGHVGGYALLTALWAWALTEITRRPVVPAALIALVYACTDEYHQSFVETRSGSVIDVGIDAIGIALASYCVSRGARAPKSKQFKDVGRSPKRAYESGT